MFGEKIDRAVYNARFLLLRPHAFDGKEGLWVSDKNWSELYPEQGLVLDENLYKLDAPTASEL